MEKSQNLLLRYPFRINAALILILIFVATMVYTIVVTSWIGDDAQITFRQVWNFIGGHGITFNFGERVQAFTHPLWFLTVSLVSFFTNELFITTIAVSVFLSTISVLLLVKIEYESQNRDSRIFSPLFLLVFSWAFVDYATSGLENALSYMLVGMLIYILHSENWKNRYQKIFLIFALLVLNRFDYGIIFLPLALYYIYSNYRLNQFIHSIWLGSLVLIAWFVFATFYFGSPLPNTYFAKLASGTTIIESLGKGIDYFLVLYIDVTTAVIILSGLVISFLSRKPELILLSIGQLLYMFYIVWIGGDFMLGRFFSVPVFLSCGQIVLAFADAKFLNKNIKEAFTVVALVVALLSGIFNGYPTLWHFFQDFKFRHATDGIYDERAKYSITSGLFSNTRGSNWPGIADLEEKSPKRYVALCPFLGSISMKNSSNHLIDLCGLSDPFIARLPAYRDENWSIGHNYRKMPTGYGEYLIGNSKEIADEKLMPLLRDVSLASRSELLEFDRFGAIWRLHTGFHSGIDYSKYLDIRTYIPSNQKTENIVLENWEAEFDRQSPAELYRFFAHNEPIRNFVNSIRFESQLPGIANNIEITLDANHSYEILVNGRLMENMQTEVNSDLNEVKYDRKFTISFENPTSVSSIQINTLNIDYSNTPWRDFQYIKLLELN